MSYIPGSLPFSRYFDNDDDFLADVNNVASWIRMKLGEPLLNVELNENQIYLSFMESCLEFSSIVNAYYAKSVLGEYIGHRFDKVSGSYENKLPNTSNLFLYNQTERYNEGSDVGGSYKEYTGSIDLEPDVQDYDLSVLPGVNASASNIIIGELYHYPPYIQYRFYSQASYVNYLMNEFGIRYFTPETAYYLLPVWEDILRTQQYKMSHKLRRSNFSYLLLGNKLRIFPIPTISAKLWLTYKVKEDVAPIRNLPEEDAISNISNIPFNVIQYNKINSIGRQWIRRFALELSREQLGWHRSKFSTIPIPSSEVTLNGGELITRARESQDKLREELRQLLEDTTFQNIIKNKRETADALSEDLSNIPMPIFVG